MRPKYILWLSVAVLAVTWYLLDPEARPTFNAASAGMTDRIAGMTSSGTESAHR